MIDVLRIAHLRIAPQEGNLEVGNCEGNQPTTVIITLDSPTEPFNGCLLYTSDAADE